MWAIPIIQQWFRKVSKYKRYNQRAQRRKFLEARGVFEKHRKKPTSTIKMPLRPVAAGVGK
jgi:hypothetical protein